MTTYQSHPIAEIWPLMEGADFDKLVADIKANGQRLPILFYQGKVLDGRNRARACEAAGIEPRYEQAAATNDNEAIALVVSLNDNRRHLSSDQRAFAAARLANITQGGDRGNQHTGGKLANESLPTKADGPAYSCQPRSILGAAHILDVSPARVARARAVLAYTPEVEKDVITKKVPLAVAAKNATASKGLRSIQSGKPVAKRSKRPSFAERIAEQTAKYSGRRLPSREEVDPEFNGTSTEWTLKYGHVQVETAEQRARGRFTDWAIGIGHLARVLEQQQLPKDVDLNWLRSPELRSIERMEGALPKLRAAVEKAEVMLAQAKAVLVQKNAAA